MRNTDTLNEIVTRDLSHLVKIVSTHSTYSLVGWCFSYNYFSDNAEPETKLHSPLKQMSFLMGVMCSTPEPATFDELTHEGWNSLIGLLNQLFNHYWLLYLPNQGDDRSALPEDWWKVREVSLQAFFNYFNSGLLASVEQVTERVKRYLFPFNEIYEAEIGISLEESLNVAKYTSTRMQEVLDNLFEIKKKEREHRESIFEGEGALEKTPEEFISVFKTDEKYAKIAKTLYEGLNKLGLVDTEGIISEFGEQGKKYLAAYTIIRGSGPALSYPTDSSVFEERPIIHDSDGRSLCLISNSLFLAIHEQAERLILSSSSKDRYLKYRDKTLEEEVLESFKKLLGGGSEYYQNIYEDDKKQHEHDLVISNNQFTLFIEAKASPPKEPLRDPEKAFVRIRDSFKSDKGIQKAFDQANRLAKTLQEEKKLYLYDENGTKVLKLSHDETKPIFIICVTRDNFGALATDLSLLLENDEADEYPWAVNILDLKNFVDAWEYLQYDNSKFIKFLSGRLRLHGKVYFADELEIAGYYIRHGNFSAFDRDDFDRIHLEPSYSDVFDDIYYAQYHDAL